LAGPCDGCTAYLRQIRTTTDALDMVDTVAVQYERIGA
jgi:hypothetical protein